MTVYIIRRIIGTLPVLFVVAAIAFLLIRLIPGSPAAALLGLEATLEQVEQIEKELGLDQPLLVQFSIYIKNLLRLDLGDSIFYKQPVIKVIFSRLGTSLTLTTFSLVIATFLGISTGMLAAFYRGSIFDNIGMTISILGISVAPFWLALNAMWLFGVYFRWLPVQGFVPITVDFWECIRHMIIPGLCIALPQAGTIARMTRSSMLDVIKQEYIRTAKAKGLKSKEVMIKHALKNAILPVLTIIGMIFAILMGSSVIIEVAFSIPGTGSVFVTAVQKRDYPLVQGGILFLGILFVVTNLIIDLLYAFIDPRIQYD